MKLELGTRIGRYEIKAPLGKGAMGEVYAAYDTELHRPVALKLISSEGDEERFRRFNREARTISGLSHPNLLTLYDFGQFESLPFIVTELINGETLRAKINQKSINLSTSLDVAIQVAAGLKAAHDSGIIHRDIKPENIMVLPDGYIKILDFGLAKLLERSESVAPGPQASTASLISTDAGLVIGTVNYMSPEQLRGQKVDERTDIWSLGVVLFEMLAGRRPFEGPSVSDVIAGILERPVMPLHSSLVEVPPLLDAILERVLSKEKDLRYQTAGDLGSALKEARHKLEIAASEDPVVSISPTEKTVSEDHAQPHDNGVVNNKIPSPPAPVRLQKFLVLSLLILLIVTAVAVIQWVRSKSISRQLNKTPRVGALLETYYDPHATISPDGRYFAFVKQGPDGKQSLQIGTVNVAGSQELVAADSVEYGGLTFTPDSNWIYFLVFGLKKNTTAGTLFRITTLGAAKQALLENVDSAVTFSADGQSLAFLRSLPESGRDQLIISDLKGKEIRVLSERIRPNFYSTIQSRETPSWSPDGKSISVPAGRVEASGDFMTVVSVDVDSGREKVLTSRKWLRVGATQWQKDGSGLIVSAADRGTELYQLYRVNIDDGTVSALLPDLRDYSSVSLSNDGKLLAVAYDKSSSIFLTSKDKEIRFTSQQIVNGQNDGLWGFTWTASGDLVYVSLNSRNRDIWLKSVGSNKPPQQLTFDEGADYSPAMSLDGHFIVFVSNRSGGLHIWRMSSDGTDQKQLTYGGEEKSPQVTADGKWVIYSSRVEGRPSLWRVSIDGGEPVRLMDNLALWPALSADGRWIACLTKGDRIDQQMTLAVFSAVDFSLSKTFELPQGMVSPAFPAVIRWLPDSSGVAYVITQNGISNIMVQPLSGKAPTRLTDFTADRVFWFEWDRKGDQLAVARGNSSNKVVLIEDF